MIMAGKQVTQMNETLSPVTIERVYQGIINPSGALATQVQQLRITKTIDANQYRRLKTQLPYIVCGIFSPAIRRKENFRHTQYFILDIDHINRYDRTVQSVREALEKDEQVMLLFTSPGADGLKALFCLHDKIEDPGYYSYFYKRFAARFATRYQLAGMVDVKTCDVSRCCFMSHDPQAYYNPQAVAVQPAELVAKDDLTAINAIQHELKTLEEAAQAMPGEEVNGGENAGAGISDDALALIKQKLNPGKYIRPARPVVQPAQLDEIMEGMRAALENCGVEVRQTEAISYGRKLTLLAGKLMAEINLFYGKKGFTVVKTTKTGSHPELADMACKLIEQYVNEHPVI